MFEHITSIIDQHTEYALDVETTGLDPLNDHLLGIALAAGNSAWYIELPHINKDRGGHYAYYKEFAKEFAHIFDNPELISIGHNWKFDKSFLASYKTILKNKLVDTMIAAHLLDESKPIGLKACVKREFNYQMTTFNEIGGLFAKGLAEYAADDARQTLRLWYHYKPKLIEQDLYEGFINIEMPLIDVVIEMEREGTRLDPNLLMQYGKDLTNEIQLCEQRIFEYAGTTFDVSSNKQLSEILFGAMGINARSLGLEKNKTNVYPTDTKILKKLSNTYPIVKYVINYRRYTKLQGTYIKPLLSHMCPETHRVHTSFWQAGTRTGRFSSSKPINFQNIPNDTKYVIRKAFVPKPGYKFIIADYSQIELRILAHASMDPFLLRVYKEGGDIHQQTADLIGCTRVAAKTINFGLIYGMEAAKLAETLGITYNEAQTFRRRYFSKLPQVGEWIHAVRERSSEMGYARTLISRRRRRIGEDGEKSKRQMSNFVIQGTSAGLIKKAMIAMYQEFKKRKYTTTKILMTIHDEVIVETPEDSVTEVSGIVRAKMENAWKFEVEIPCSLKVCSSWAEGK